MGFRELVDGSRVSDVPVSVNFDMKEESETSGNEPILFNEIIESPGHRAAINILTRQRLCEAFEVQPGELIDILSWAMENPSDPVLIESEGSPVLENTMVVPDLLGIPIPWHYREDGGRYQSASIIIAQYGGLRNTSFHRQLVKDESTTCVRLVPRHLRTMVNTAQEKNDEVPIAVVNGPDPVVLLAAAMSFDEPLDELRVAAALHERLYGSQLEVVELSNGVVVPAISEYAMEARITTSTGEEGPYVDITGTVDDIRLEPVIKYDKIHHRNDPIFHALIPAGIEHMTLMGMPRAPTIKTAVSEVVTCTDVYLTDGGSGWLSSVVQIIPEESGDGMKAIKAALDGHKSMKQVIVVDNDIDVTDSSRVEWALMTRWQPDRDTLILSSQKGSSLDPSRSSDGTTSKIGMDATIEPGIDRSPYESVL
ncbi:MAG: UbiD family decarboxylase [Candidatus Thalassarchaeaceae archaeon]|nr:UbiD family decarboxylase [Candidatus Thalassarchaeaceae archaeon]